MFCVINLAVFSKFQIHFFLLNRALMDGTRREMGQNWVISLFLSFFNVFLKKMRQSWPLFVYFRSFLVTISLQIKKRINGVLGIRTRGRRMVGADETMQLWRPLFLSCYDCLYPSLSFYTTIYLSIIVFIWNISLFMFITNTVSISIQGAL